MENLLKLLVLVYEYGVTCRDSFHIDVGEDAVQFMPYEVLSSAAGYYLGYFCPVCGPYDRASGYYKTREMAERSLTSELNGCLLHYFG